VPAGCSDKNFGKGLGYGNREAGLRFEHQR